VRRILQVLVAVALAGGAWFGAPAHAQAQAPSPPPAQASPAGPAPTAPPSLLPPIADMLAERSLGRADAPITVIEYASLTCPHCAAFHKDVLPQVKRELIDTGRVRFVYRDYPLDRVALAGAMAARCLPAAQHAGFVDLLMAEQQAWAFRGNPIENLKRMAGLAGMPEGGFEACLGSPDLQRGILEQRLRADQEHRVESTPTFIAGNRRLNGNAPFDRFVRELGLR